MMRKSVPVSVAAALLLLAASDARAEPSDPLASHPADTSRPVQSPETIEPFDLAVPLLSRDQPNPSYGSVRSDTDAPDAAPDAEAMPGMDHRGMDHGNMTH
jgi:hypothetical protein